MLITQSVALFIVAGLFEIGGGYWFIRQIESKNDQFVREFLNAFEKARKENREKASGDASSKKAVDNELLTFDRLNRSTDDVRSHEERYRILVKRFRTYLKAETGKSRR